MDLTEKEILEIAEKVDLEKLGEILGQIGDPESPLGKALAEVPADLRSKLIPYCGYYCAGRPLLPIALAIIEKIPPYGAKIAGLIRVLAAIADVVCGCEQ